MNRRRRLWRDYKILAGGENSGVVREEETMNRAVFETMQRLSG